MANAIINGMDLTIDKFGRVVLPKKLRQHLGVRAGLRVKVTETADGVLLQPAQQESGLILQHGLLIHRGGAPDAEPIDWRKLIEEDREERIQHILNP